MERKMVGEDSCITTYAWLLRIDTRRVAVDYGNCVHYEVYHDLLSCYRAVPSE